MSECTPNQPRTFLVREENELFLTFFERLSDSPVPAHSFRMEIIFTTQLLKIDHCSIKMRNMKKLFSIICTVMIITQVGATDEKIVPSEIKRVTVYTQGAQIYRTSGYSIGKGVTEVIIEGVSPMIDAKSLQVKASGSVIILDSKYSIFYPKPEETPLEGLPLQVQRDIRALEDSIRTVNYEIQELQDEIDIMVATKNILANNGAIKGQGKVNDSIALLKDAIDYYMLKMSEVNKKLLKLNREKNIKTDIRTGMNNRLTTLRNWQTNADLNSKPKGPVHRIIVTLKADDYAKGKLDISYLVSGAGWIPMYDLRSEIANGKVNLNYKAQVFQSTGIDWEDVPLTISTNNPYHNKTKPTLHPWYVDFYNGYGYSGGGQREQLDLQQKAKKLSNQPMYSSVSGAEEVTIDALTSDQFVQVVDQVISAEFKIDLPYTIKSNNEQHMVLVKNIDLAANYKYYTVPKYDAAAYLVAELTKLDELQLVPAKANIFFDGSYIGETYLDPTTMDDTLELSLGKDPNIIVKRTLLKRECKDKVIGPKMERTFAWAIEIKNLKSSNIEVIVQDQLPITQNPEIEITADELSKGELDSRTGIVEWRVNLKAMGSKELKMTYVVKHNKDQNVPLL